MVSRKKNTFRLERRPAKQGLRCSSPAPDNSEKSARMQERSVYYRVECKLWKKLHQADLNGRLSLLQRSSVDIG